MQFSLFANTINIIGFSFWYSKALRWDATGLS